MKKPSGEFLPNDQTYQDPSQKSDQELEKYMLDLCHTIGKYNNASAREPILRMLQIAQTEKNSRTTSKLVEASNKLSSETINLTKKTIGLWKFAIVVSCTGIVLATIIGVLNLPKT